MPDVGEEITNDSNRLYEQQDFIYYANGPYFRINRYNNAFETLMLLKNDSILVVNKLRVPKHTYNYSVYFPNIKLKRLCDLYVRR